MTTSHHSSRRTLRRRLQGGIAVAAIATVLAGCGGSDDGPDPYEAKGEPVPVAAGSSLASFVSYIAGLTASETDEPLVLDGFTPPTDETTEL